MRFLVLSAFVSLLFISCKDQSNKHPEQHAFTNELIHESSPYLLQHAHNPVNWHAWNDETLAKAKTENKLLLISVGYAACHWCHVMEHESFEDTLVARIMNEHFINIKVDREERPDVDDVYMSACNMVSKRSCGWPLNAFALPNGKPVWAGTYFPKKEWLNVLEYFTKAYQDDPDKMSQYADDLTKGIQEQDAINFNESKQNFSEEALNKISSDFLQIVDFQNGGKKGAPKFPMPNNWDFLLRMYHYNGNLQALNAVEKTLNEMANGGIYDHLGGGFARYSTDVSWLVPHFEKMLYDNGQLVSLYSDAYKLTKNPLYKIKVEETLDFIKRELTDSTGGFYSSLDADSEGEEGKFYVWTKHEIDSLAAPEDAKIFNEYYQIKEKGNWEEEKNILHVKKSLADLAEQNKTGVANLKSAIDRVKKVLLAERSKRVRPGLDDKILTSWNALMLKGYADAFAAFGTEEYRAAAIKNGNFILEEAMQENGRLNRNYKDGKSVINAFADDYALTIHAFIALYQITFDENWLNQADKLAQYAIEHFFNPETKMFYYTSKLDSKLIARKTELSDNVIPGSNSSMAKALFALGTYMYKPDYLEKSAQMMHNMQTQIVDSGQPNFYSNWCTLYLDLVRPPYEVAIVGDNYAEKRDKIIKNYLPNALFLGGKTEGNLELLEGKLQEGETMIYVCQNKVCKLPVQEVEAAIKLLE